MITLSRLRFVRVRNIYQQKNRRTMLIIDSKVLFQYDRCKRLRNQTFGSSSSQTKFFCLYRIYSKVSNSNWISFFHWCVSVREKTNKIAPMSCVGWVSDKVKCEMGAHSFLFVYSLDSVYSNLRLTSYLSDLECNRTFSAWKPSRKVLREKFVLSMIIVRIHRETNRVQRRFLKIFRTTDFNKRITNWKISTRWNSIFLSWEFLKENFYLMSMQMQSLAEKQRSQLKQDSIEVIKHILWSQFAKEKLRQRKWFRHVNLQIYTENEKNKPSWSSMNEKQCFHTEKRDAGWIRKRNFLFSDFPSTQVWEFFLWDHKHRSWRMIFLSITSFILWFSKIFQIDD